MRIRLSSIVVAAAVQAAAAQVTTLATPRYVNDRELVLAFQSDNDAPVDQIHLFASTDGGRDWERFDAERIAPAALRCTVPADGRYDFFLVLENAAGKSAAEPAPAARPHLSIFVDTAPPTVQIHTARVQPGPDGVGALQIELTLIEENLSEAGIRLFYRDHDATGWIDAGAVRYDGGRIRRALPADIAAELDLRLVVTDLAGNRTVEESVGITADRTPAANHEATNQPYILASDAQTITDAEQNKTRSRSPLEDKPERVVPSDPLASSRAATDESVLALRQAAARFMGQDRFALAATRLEEALGLAPEDPDLLVDLGSALYRGRDYSGAAQRFGSVLESLPEHVGALEGLALVEATQRRYPQAREHLNRLLRIQPEDGVNWLHLGDIEHKLGNAREAVDAWERVLDLDADIELREKAQERLKYFGPRREAGGS